MPVPPLPPQENRQVCYSRADWLKAYAILDEMEQNMGRAYIPVPPPLDNGWKLLIALVCQAIGLAGLGLAAFLKLRELM